MLRGELHGEVFRIPEWPWPVCAVLILDSMELCARAASYAVEAPESFAWSAMCAEHAELERRHGRRLVELEALEEPGRRLLAEERAELEERRRELLEDGGGA